MTKPVENAQETTQKTPSEELDKPNWVSFSGVDEIDKIMSKLFSGVLVRKDDKRFEEAKAKITKLINEAVIKELANYKAAYATDLSVEAYDALADRIKSLRKEQE